MVFEKIREALSPSDEKYEVLYYRYSKLKLENQHLKEKMITDSRVFREDLSKGVALDLIKLYEHVEVAKQDSFKVKATDKDVQRLMVDLNTVERELRAFMKKFSLEEISAGERFFDPELHEVASYEDAKGMTKGIILNTVRKGFRYKGKIIKRPKVLVTK